MELLPYDPLHLLYKVQVQSQRANQRYHAKSMSRNSFPTTPFLPQPLPLELWALPMEPRGRGFGGSLQVNKRDVWLIAIADQRAEVTVWFPAGSFIIQCVCLAHRSVPLTYNDLKPNPGRFSLIVSVRIVPSALLLMNTPARFCIACSAAGENTFYNKITQDEA